MRMGGIFEGPPQRVILGVLRVVLYLVSVLLEAIDYTSPEPSPRTLEAAGG